MCKNTYRVFSRGWVEVTQHKATRRRRDCFTGLNKNCVCAPGQWTAISVESVRMSFMVGVIHTAYDYM
jgi:hypothetical protein